MMRFRFAIPFVVFIVCVLLLASMVSIASDETISEPEDALLTHLPFVGSGFMTGGFTRIAFDRYLDGTPFTADTILNGDEFSAAGISLAGAPTGSYCADATSTAVLVPPHSVGGIDFTFLTSSRPDTSLGCNAVPIEITFSQAVSEVTIVFDGAAVVYILTAYDGDDNELGIATQAADADPEAVTFSSASSNIKRVTFGHELAITAVTEIIFRR